MVSSLDRKFVLYSPPCATVTQDKDVLVCIQILLKEVVWEPNNL